MTLQEENEKLRGLLEAALFYVPNAGLRADISAALSRQAEQQPEQEPFWYAVVSEQAPTINSAIKRLDVAQEFADSKRERWPDTRVVPLYTTQEK